MKKIISFFMVIALFLQALPVSLAAQTEQSWLAEIGEVKVLEKLQTEQQEVNYDGSTNINTFVDKPKEGFKYVLIDLTVSQINKEKQQEIDLTNITLKIGENVYKRVENDTFLKNHDIDPIIQGEVIFGSYTGMVLFEV